MVEIEIPRETKEKAGLISELRKIKLDRTPTQVSNDPEYQWALPLLRKVYKDVEYWHGTGRYKYANPYSDELVDILGGLIDESRLQPHPDNWDRKRGAINTISVAPSRMYARLYAGMYIPNGGKIENELGTRRLWGYYFIGSSAIVGMLEHRPTLADIRKKGVRAFSEAVLQGDKNKYDEWAGKITKKGFAGIYEKGTDIKANYPILIGVKKGVLEPTDNSRFIELHEKRSESPVAVKGFTHIEVPKDKVEETTQTLQRAGHDRVPVFPIEYGEEYCRQFSFLKLTGKKPLAN